MKYKFGVYGSHRIESEQAVRLAGELGSVLAQNNIIVVTGACSGMPYLVAQAAKRDGAEVWGFTPAHNEQEHQGAFPSDDMAVYDRLFFVPEHYDQSFFLGRPSSPPADWGVRLKYRNVVSTTHVHAGIILTGGWGTMNEFTNLVYEAKPVGVLTGTGGLADELLSWYPRLPKKSESPVLFRRSPTDLVSDLLQSLA